MKHPNCICTYSQLKELRKLSVEFSKAVMADFSGEASYAVLSKVFAYCLSNDIPEDVFFELHWDGQHG